MINTHPLRLICGCVFFAHRKKKKSMISHALSADADMICYMLTDLRRNRKPRTNRIARVPTAILTLCVI